MRSAQSLLQPYYRSQADIVVTAIEITDEMTPKVKVFWSRKLVERHLRAWRGKGNDNTVPAALNIKGSFLVRVVSSLSTTSRSSPGPPPTSRHLDLPPPSTGFP